MCRVGGFFRPKVAAALAGVGKNERVLAMIDSKLLLQQVLIRVLVWVDFIVRYIEIGSTP